MRTAPWALLAIGLLACSSPEGETGGAGGGGGAAGGSSAPGGTGGHGDGGSEPAPEKAKIHFMGRFDESDPQGPRFAWPGSAVYARFEGTAITLELDDEQANFFAVTIDDGPPTRLSTSSGTTTYTLAEGLAAGEHTVWIEKRTESFVGAARFLDLVPEGGALKLSPAPYERLIEFVGDSITCGYGNEGDGSACGFTPDTENEALAYGALAARALDAGHLSLCYSGIGVYRNGDGSTTDQMPVLYDRIIADDPGSTWSFTQRPDVVVINLGTNDFAQGDPTGEVADAYEEAMVSFVEAVRGHYPEAVIVLALGSMLNDSYPEDTMALTKARAALTSVVSRRKDDGDEAVSLVDLQEQEEADDYGCDYHPSLVTHQKMADRLETAIRKLMNW